MIKKHLILLIFSLATANVFAQSSSGPILWLQADSGISVNIDKVSSWADQSGHKNTATQPDPNHQPTYLPNIVNGHSAIKFYGWPYQFLNAPSIFPCKKDYTITAVIRIDDSTAIQNILSGDQHALFFSGDLYPRVVHEDFSLTGMSRLK